MRSNPSLPGVLPWPVASLPCSLASRSSPLRSVAVIRRDISKYEARLNTIGRLTAMSNAHIILRDDKDFVPVTTPSYGPTVKGTFDESLESLGRFGKWLLVVGAAAAPWTVVAIPVVLLLWVARRLSGGGKRYRPPALPHHTERREWSEPSDSLGEVGPTEPQADHDHQGRTDDR